MHNHDEPRVYLVGAGPGDPGLLTLRAVECLGRADLVVYDKLVPRRLLDFAPRAEHVCVADLPGGHPQRWPHILSRVREAAAAGKVVVRLKGGDPLIFGRGTEEAEDLRAALSGLADAVRAAGLAAPALVMIGPATARAPELSWLERRPLFGRRVLVTRPKRQAEEMARRLERLGAVPYLLPAVDVLPPAD